ncbi:MAG: hypothetical protein MZV63_60235 [Marinilabiliales bacterium]|nr:hypothetical protein [Marinilabiliales bacterium]
MIIELRLSPFARKYAMEPISIPRPMGMRSTNARIRNANGIAGYQLLQGILAFSSVL